MTELFVAEEHSQLYDLWLERGDRNLSVCHIDFHCDMRGLLIDRTRGRACFVERQIPYVHRLDSGSYLSHAIMNGMVVQLRWVHDSHGGREYDYLHCVKYESDPSALPYRLPGKRTWASLDYAEQTFEEWGGPRPGEFIDIDWDAIASAEYDEQKIRYLMAGILGRNFNPETIFLARSPGYCHADRGLFEEFVAGLEAKFAVRAVRLPAVTAPPPVDSFFWSIYARLDKWVFKLMHRFGIH